MDEILNPEGLADQFESPETEQKDKVIIKAIGVGGGGGNAVNYMFRQGIKHVSFVVLNTDRQALRQSPVPTKVMIGDGLGAGDRPEVAREAAENDIAKIEALFQDDTRMVFITSGMGGGTGTGASPVVARVAREKGLLTIGIVTIPFYFEGEEKINKAFAGADEMAKYVDALLLINNERLTEIYGDLDFINGFGKADDTLATAACSISELITCDGYMNLDFNDVNTTLRDGGAAIISSGYGEGENRVTKALEDALASPLLKHRDISTAKRLLFNIYFSQEANNKFKLSEVNELTSFVQKINPKVKIIWGVAFDKDLGEQIKITMLASGFNVDHHGHVGALESAHACLGVAESSALAYGVDAGGGLEHFHQLLSAEFEVDGVGSDGRHGYRCLTGLAYRLRDNNVVEFFHRQLHLDGTHVALCRKFQRLIADIGDFKHFAFGRFDREDSVDVGCHGF